MKILHIAYSLNEQSAAYRLAKEQAIVNGNQIFFFLARKSTSSFIQARRIFPFFSSFIGIFSHLLDYIFNKCLVKGEEVFSMGLNFPFKNKILKYLILKVKPNVIHIHWGGYSFITPVLLNDLSKFNNINLVITTHDYYYFTGGCHIPMNCAAFKNNCNNCPMSRNVVGQLWISNNRNIANKLFNNKNIRFVSPSLYTQNYIKSIFSILKFIIIPNTAGKFYSIDQFELNEGFEIFKKYKAINDNVPTLLIVGVKTSLRQNKGNDIIVEITKRFLSNELKINIITIGEFIDLDINGTHLHFIHRTMAEMQQLYFLVDLCIVASRFETFSQVTLESIQSGTPVVAFDLTGPADIIENKISGFLVKSFDINQFYNKIIDNIQYKLNNKEIVIQSALNASLKFSPTKVTAEYQKVYQKMDPIIK